MSRYQAIAAEINRSCYNCSRFKLDESMLSGLCQLTLKEKSALGTCDHFTMKATTFSKLDFRKKQKA